jgi:hypothetical protein
MIKGMGMNLPNTIEITMQDITGSNRKTKFYKAVFELSKALNIPCRLQKAITRPGHNSESYLYHVQQELSNKWVNFYKNIFKNIYTVVITALGLPPVGVETMMKSIDDSVLKYRGKILYNPENGNPIQKKEFEALIKAVDNFLNRKTAMTGQKIILDSVAIEKILRRMAKYQTTKDMEKLTLDTIKYRGKSFDWIRETTKHIQEAFRIDGLALSRDEMARYQVAQDWVAQKVTRINNEVREEIKDTILNGIVEKRSRSQVSQDLFNRLGSLNRDWKRIADTEIVNTSNLAGILEEVNRRTEGEKVYFKRYELPGCCDKCKEIDGMVVLWSDTQLESDKIKKDKNAKVAIWEGKAQDKKMNTVVPGALHPNCRGGWLPWGGKTVDAVVAHIQNKGEMWDRAVETARKEFKEKGIDNPDDQTKGYTERINEIYHSLTE